MHPPHTATSGSAWVTRTSWQRHSRSCGGTRPCGTGRLSTPRPSVESSGPRARLLTISDADSLSMGGLGQAWTRERVGVPARHAARATPRAGSRGISNAATRGTRLPRGLWGEEGTTAPVRAGSRGWVCCWQGVVAVLKEGHTHPLRLERVAPLCEGKFPGIYCKIPFWYL